MIDDIEPANTDEENEEIINEIYINSWAQNEFVIDSNTIAILENIALQNPILGGPGVYRARVMLNMDVNDDYVEYEERVRSNKPTKHVSSKNALGVIVPNPNTGLMQYKAIIKPSKKGILEIYGVLGKLMLSYDIYPDQENMLINMENVPSGIYPYKIILDNEIQEFNKIVIQK